jgi:hypothetical protein
MVLKAVTLAAIVGSVLSGPPLQQGSGTYEFLLATESYSTPVSFGALLNNAIVKFAMN